MGIDASRALVPFNGLIHPVMGTGHKEIDQYESRNRHLNRTFSGGFGSDRMNRIYGRFGKEYKDSPGRGENIDIYV
jgi:hypothetical protein